MSSIGNNYTERQMQNKNQPGGLPERGGGQSMNIDQERDGINWHDYNYPPVLNLMHYDKEELPTAIENITKFQKLFFEIVVVACGLNLADNIILVFAEQNEKVLPMVRILYSMLNCIIFPPGALFIFHQGYKGLAISSASLLTQYKVIQAIGAFVMFFFMCFHFFSLNGLSTFWTPQYKAAKMKTLWSIIIVAESLIHGGNLANAIGCLVQVQNFNPYATQTRNPGTSI